MKKLFKKFDQNLKKNKKGYVSFAKSQGFTYYSEYVWESFKKFTSSRISQDMHEAGVEDAPSVNAVTSLIFRIRRDMVIPDNVSRPKKSKRKMCMKCGKREVSVGNHAHCAKCFHDNKRLSVWNDTEIHHINYTGGY